MGGETKLSRLDVEDHDASSVGLKLGGTLVTASASELNRDSLTLRAYQGKWYIVGAHQCTIA